MGGGGGPEGLTRALFLGAGLRKVIFEIGHLSNLDGIVIMDFKVTEQYESTISLITS